jgi:hypothetical protein
MPSVNIHIDPAKGPVVLAVITPSQYRLSALKAANLPAPQPTSGLFLVDTGASHTCVDPTILQPLQLTPTGTSSFQTPSTNGTPVQSSSYDVQMHIMPLNSKGLSPQPHSRAVCVSSMNFLSQGISGLIGRDILEHCHLVYNGHTQSFSLCW